MSFTSKKDKPIQDSHFSNWPAEHYTHTYSSRRSEVYYLKRFFQRQCGTKGNNRLSWWRDAILKTAELSKRIPTE